MTDHQTMIAEMGEKAREAFGLIANASDADKAAALRASAQSLRTARAEILAANSKDMERGKERGLSNAMLDRLMIDEERLEGIATAVDNVAVLPDPVGAVIDQSERPNGLVMQRIRVPLGVIGIIYESRPNVTADAAALGLRSGNAVILRGGSEAIESNRAIHKAMVAGLKETGLPENAIQFVNTSDREAVGELLKAEGLIDMVIPRGGKSLVERVSRKKLACRCSPISTVSVTPISARMRIRTKPSPLR